MPTPLTLHTRTVDRALPLEGLALQWQNQGARLCWLDSGIQRAGSGRVSVLCQAPKTAFALGRSCRRADADPLLTPRLRAAFERGRERRPGCGRSEEFTGGWIGYVAYEAQIDFDAYFPDRNAVLPFPRLWFVTVNRGVTVNHAEGRTTLWAWESAGGTAPDFDAWTAALGSPPVATPADAGVVGSGWALRDVPLDRQWYCASVAEILERIAAGEVYQVNLTAPVDVRAGVDPLRLYLSLRSVSAGDYSAFIRWPGLTILASSPEEFFRLSDKTVMSRPMKGTRARSGEPLAEADRREELRTSEKDRAENLMIVDLVRNDLGRIAIVGSVEVSDLFSVEEYSTVYQMTSTVRAQLRPGEDVFSALSALFPPGSMTGAPKIQATRVIRQLEPGPRGIYSGCLGLIDWSGDAVFNVVIRTLVSHRDGASWSVGGGIVADSVPEAEYREALAKLEAMKRAVSRAAVVGPSP